MTTKTIASVGLALILTALATTKAEAKQTVQFDRHAVSGGYYYGPQVAGLKQVRRKAQKKRIRERPAVPRNYAMRLPRHAVRHAAQILPHPPGCPRTRFCGCGVSLHVFGKVVRTGGLAVAANWLKFPKAEPGPGKVAARRGHVYAILRDMGRDRSGNRIVLAYDPNSGRHQTKIHVRSLRGYTVVDPRGGSQYASAG